VRRGDDILVVDDDPDARSLLIEALSKAGFATRAAADGDIALAMTKAAPPGLIILDAIMPGLSGFETCRRLKAVAEHADLPVIFTTGLGDTDSVIEGLRSGGVDYITKPIVIDELLARIRVHLATARMAHSARKALDVTGRSLIAADPAGRLLWSTPQASELMTSMPGDAAWTDGLAAAIAAVAGNPEAPVGLTVRFALGERQVQATYVGRGGLEEAYFRLDRVDAGSIDDLLKGALGITTREAEVLVWISRGKSNRDISDILNISPRTVNKHLEGLFVKLGVENRTAAAAIASRVIATSAFQDL
jgi:DNA-binding NarL/FixJ family response regulator